MPPPARTSEIRRYKRRLELHGYPRLQMSLLVLLTGAAGMLASYLLLRGGIQVMALRYPLALGIAYIVFLVLLWLWLRTKARDYVDWHGDLPLPGGGGGSSLNPEIFQGGGGSGGGGGASGSFVTDAQTALPDAAEAGSTVLDGAGDAAGEVLGSADEGVVPLALIALAVAVAASLAFAMGYIVYLAPSLFAELLVDGALSATLYKRIKGTEAQHWLESAVRRTVVPFALCALFLGCVGGALHLFSPGAHTLGEAIQGSRIAAEKPVR